MGVSVSEHMVNMLAVFLAVSLAAERVVQVLKNFLRWLKELDFAQKIIARFKDGLPGGLRAAQPQNEEDGNWAKLWPRVAAVIIAAVIAKCSEKQLLPLLQPIFGDAKSFDNYQALVIGLFAAAGSDFWSQLLGTLKEIKRVRQVDADLKKHSVANVKGKTG